jgi:hypothetical protein
MLDSNKEEEDAISMKQYEKLTIDITGIEKE